MAMGVAARAPALRRARVMMAGAFFVQGLTVGALLTRLPALQDRHKLSPVAVTGLVGAVAIAAGLGSLFAAIVVRRVGSAAALRGGLIGMLAAMVLIALADSRVVLFTGIGLFGLAIGTVDATMNIRGVAVQGRYGQSIMISFHGSFSIGAALGGLCTAASAGLGWALGPSLLVVAALAAVLVALIAPFPLPAAPGSGPPAVSEPPVEPGSSAAPGGRRGSVLLVGIAIVCFFVVDAATANWGVLYLSDGLGAAQSIAALGFSCYQATTLGVRLVGDRVVRRRGAVWTIRNSAVIGALGLAVITAATAPAVAIVGFALLGLGMAAIPPLAYSAAGHLDEQSGIARINAAGYVGYLAGSLLVGGIVAVSALRVGFLLPMGLAVVIITLAPAFAAAGDSSTQSPPPRAASSPPSPGAAKIFCESARRGLMLVVGGDVADAGVQIRKAREAGLEQARLRRIACHRPNPTLTRPPTPEHDLLEGPGDVG
jgi:MFS family permease